MRGVYYQRVKCCATCIHCIEDGVYLCEQDDCELSTGELADVYCQHWKLRTEPANEYEMTGEGMKKKGL